jgi:ABC-type phosphate/phosphonate transport system substrate-binding protein
VRVADLPWYDLPELRAATDAWWRGIAGHLAELGVDDLPAALRRDVAHERNWQERRLLLSQACGYDVIYDAEAVLVPVATPCYASAGCTGPRYRSAVVVRADDAARELADLRGRRCAVNEATSHSGVNALRPLVAALSRGGAFFGQVLVTGAHTDSLGLVQKGGADVAAIDVVVLDLVMRVRPQALAGLRVLAHTDAALAPPYVTSVHTDAETRTRLRLALQRAAADPRLHDCRAALRIERLEFPPASAYAELRAFEAPALQAGYFELPAPRRSPLSRDSGGHARSGCGRP